MSSRKPKKNTERPNARQPAQPGEAGHEEPASAGADSSEAGDAHADPMNGAGSIAEALPGISEITELRPREVEPQHEDASFDLHDEAELTAQSEPQDAVAEQDAPEPPKSRLHLKRVIESLIFVSEQVLSAQQIGRIVKAKQAEVRELVAELSSEYEGRGIELIEVAGGYQFRSAAVSAPFVRDLVAQRPVRLTRAQLETLALIAYRQPITRPEIDDVRGVDSGSAIKILLERDLVKILGRKDEPGRPLLYGTAPYFLEFFGMKTMQDLPTLREFTELNEEHRELFQKKLGEIPDLSAESDTPLAFNHDVYVDVDDEPAVAAAAEPPDALVESESVARSDSDAEAESADEESDE